MKTKILHNSIRNAVNLLVLIFVTSLCSAQSMPDTVAAPYGWRYATQADADYWPTVSPGDVLLFGATDSQTGIRYIPQRVGNGPINVQGGQKIHIWRGNYGQIKIEVIDSSGAGAFVETNSSEMNPVIITNFGGQVKFGAFGLDRGYGHFNVAKFKHVFVTGEYDPVLGTGDPSFLGMDGDMTTHGWINRFGIMGDREYSTFELGQAPGTGLILRKFLSAKIRGVAVVRGFFTGFSIKSDDINFGTHTTIDIQKCLSGWHTNEGFYIGSTAGNASTVPDNKVTFKNNVVLFAGGEGIQADKLSAGTRIENNFVYKTACFYQAPHEPKAHEHGFQWSFVEGDVRAEDNIIYCGSSGPVINSTALVAKSGITLQTSEIVLANNLLGPSLSRFAYVHPPTAANAERVTFRIHNNIIDKMFPTDQNDAYTQKRVYGEWIELINKTSPFYLTDNLYPAGLPLYLPTDANVVSTSGSHTGTAPPLLLHGNFGFDPAEILSFRGVWLTGSYESPATSTGPITYNAGDIVYMLEGRKTRYYKCLQTHSDVRKPSTNPTSWQKLTWNGHDEPAYTPLLQAGSVYHTRGMGLDYNAPPPPTACEGAGQITREYWANVVGYNVSDIPVNDPPTSTTTLTVFDGPRNQADNYGSRIRGYICAPVSGDYVFWISSDDKSELWLSTDENPANKVKIASVTVWTQPDEWTKYATQQSAPVNLVAGQKYYIEAIHKEISGTDHLTVGWTLPNGTLERPIPGTRLFPFAVEQEEIWNSYDITIGPNSTQQGVIVGDQSTSAVVEFYESTDDFGVTKGSLFTTHNPTNHPNGLSHTTNYWANGSGGVYPYAGLSTVARGADTGEGNSPEPAGVIDLQLHPPIGDKLVVAAFLVPKAGNYEISNLAARRVSDRPLTGTGTIRFQVFDQNKAKKADIIATNNQDWVTDANTVLLEGLDANDRIYFAASRDGDYEWDFTEVAWTVTFVPGGSSATARTKSNLEEELVTDVTEQTNSELREAIYPNPVENTININGLKGDQVGVRIFNGQGTLVSQQNISGHNGGAALPVGSYPPGIYYMVLQTGNEIKRLKFIKE